MMWAKTSESISEIERLCNEYGIRNWTINSEGLVDVEGDVYLGHKELTKIPINFGRVEGSFDCGNNKLKNLEGAPREVSGSFILSVKENTEVFSFCDEFGLNFY